MSDDGIDEGGLPDFLADPKGMLRRRWRLMALVGLLGVVGTLTFVLTLPVTYLATASILVSSQKIPDHLIQTTVIESPFQRINALVGELTSRDRLLELEERLDLYPSLRGTAGSSELVQVMRENIDINADGGVGNRAAYETSMIYAVSFRHADPNNAAAAANDLASQFTTASIRMRGQQARRTTEFMRTQLEDKERELRVQDSKITAFKEQFRGELPGELSANLGKLERLATERKSVRDSLAKAETRLAMLSTGKTADAPNSSPARLSALRGKLAAELSIHTAEHPNILSLKRQIATLEKEVASGVGVDPTRRVLLESAQREITEFRLRLSEIAGELRSREVQVAKTPKREEALKALQDQAKVMRDEYLSLLKKVETAELAERLESAQQGERASVLDRALPPTAPERTRIKFLLVGLLGSLGLAGALGAVLEMLDPVLSSASQIESQLGLPVLGSVPRL